MSIRYYERPSGPNQSLWGAVKTFFDLGGFNNPAPLTSFGRVWYVDTINGGDGPTNGRAWDRAFQTMDRAFDFVGNHDTIVVSGVVREQLTSPVGIWDVAIVGAQKGGNRQATDNGVATGGGSCWLPPASGAAAATPLLNLINQGWSIRNMLFSPHTSSPCVQIQRAAASGSTPEKDGSHAKLINCKFVGGTTANGIQLKDGGYNVIIADCEFESLAGTAILSSGTGVSVPAEIKILRNRFNNNGNCIAISSNEGLVQGNIFRHTTNDTTNKVNLISVSSQGSNNFVLDNYFSDVVANYAIAKGYKPGTSDVWRNWCTGAADAVIVVPA